MTPLQLRVNRVCQWINAIGAITGLAFGDGWMAGVGIVGFIANTVVREMTR